MAVLLTLTLASSTSFAKGEKFPDKGWHKGPYLTANVGMIQVTNDKHVVTGLKFDGTIEPEFGLTFGWDIADWIGPMLQINYSTSTASVGDPNGGNNGGAAYASNPGVTFPAGTFPVENARQHIVDFSLYARATLPYFTRAGWQPDKVKIIPYAKLGGTGHAMYVNAPTAANKGGALGGGPAVGLGCEFFIWKGLFIALDATEHFIIQKAFYRNITTNAGVQNFKILEGGMKPHFALTGLFGCEAPKPPEFRVGMIVLGSGPLVPMLAAPSMEGARIAVDELNARGRRRIERVSPAAAAALERYEWPGNVRELRNVIERAVVVSQGELITELDLSDRLRADPEPRVDMQSTKEIALLAEDSDFGRGGADARCSAAPYRCAAAIARQSAGLAPPGWHRCGR